VDAAVSPSVSLIFRPLPRFPTDGGDRKRTLKSTWTLTVDSQQEYSIVDFIFAERVGRPASRLAGRLN